MEDLDAGSTSDIEATVLAHLNQSTPTPVRTPAPTLQRPEKKRKRTRKRSMLTAKDPTSLQVRAALSSAAKAAEERALAIALVRPPPASMSPIKVAADEGATASQVVVAKELRPSRRKPGKTGDRRRSGSAKVQSDRGTSSAKGSYVTRDASQFVDDFRREIGRFGSQALGKRDRKSFETAELVRLGCRPPKNEKMPIGLLVAQRKRQSVRDAKKKEMDLASGMLVRSKRK